jgi:phosphopantetheinyl transferase
MHIGVDLERLDALPAEDWLNGAFAKQELSLVTQLDKATSVGLWCAKEAVAKALGTGLQGVPAQWQITHYSTDSQEVTVTHEGKPFLVKLWHLDHEVLAICQSPATPQLSHFYG